MKKIDEMIKQLCPNGVEKVKLGNVARLVRGKVISKMYVAEHAGEYPVYSSQTANNGVFGKIDSYMFDGDYLTWTTDGVYAGTVFRRKGKFNITNICGLIDIKSKDINIDFLFYWLSITTSKYVNKGIDNPKLMSNVVELIEIPIPPLSIQKEIVRVLDKFSELIEKTDEEIALRQKQYAYYKRILFSKDYPTMKIGDITRVFSASRVHKNEWKTSGVPFYRSSDVISFHRGEKNSRGDVFISEELFEKLSAKSGKIRIGDLLVTGGGTIGVPYIVQFEPLYVKDADLLCIIKNDTLDNRFLYHYMKSEQFHDYLSSITHDATIAHYTISQIKETPVPVPSWDEQQRLIDTLDKFETLISKLKEERELRQKQYEYYREKLLTF